jgi:hypothetical protein
MEYRFLVCLLLVAVLAQLLSLRFRHIGKFSRSLSGPEDSTLFLPKNATCLVLVGWVGEERTLFLIDTGYAGPPVLNTDFLASGHGFSGATERDIDKRLTDLRVSRRGHRAAVDKFVAAVSGMEFTAGCRMNLSGITNSMQKHSDLLLVPPILFQGVTNRPHIPSASSNIPKADVMVTNSMESTPHILTSDYIRHRAPCLLQISRRRVRWCLSYSEFLAACIYMSKAKTHFIGGAYAVDVTVGKHTFTCLMDTGSESGLTLGRHASERLDEYTNTAKRVRQSGIGGQTDCSPLVSCRVKLGPHEMADFPVVLSSTDHPMVDGYVGMGLLRSFDIMISKTDVFFAPSGLLPLKVSDVVASSCR